VISAFIVKNIIMMCSLNLRPGAIVPVDCVDYMQECVIKSPNSSGSEAAHYIQCQTQYFTLYNSYASFVCAPKEEPLPPGKAGPNKRRTERTIKGTFK
jgi:hypothetical protein